jgi:hypothetical protein
MVASAVGGAELRLPGVVVHSCAPDVAGARHDALVPVWRVTCISSKPLCPASPRSLTTDAVRPSNGTRPCFQSAVASCLPSRTQWIHVIVSLHRRSRHELLHIPIILLGLAPTYRRRRLYAKKQTCRHAAAGAVSSTRSNRNICLPSLVHLPIAPQWLSRPPASIVAGPMHFQTPRLTPTRHYQTASYPRVKAVSPATMVAFCNHLF